MVRRLNNKIIVLGLAAYFAFLSGVPQGFVLCYCCEELVELKAVFLDACGIPASRNQTPMTVALSSDDVADSCGDCNSCGDVPSSSGSIAVSRSGGDENRIKIIFSGSLPGLAGLAWTVGSFQTHYFAPISRSLKPPRPDFQAVETIVLLI